MFLILTMLWQWLWYNPYGAPHCENLAVFVTNSCKCINYVIMDNKHKFGLLVLYAYKLTQFVYLLQYYIKQIKMILGIRVDNTDKYYGFRLYQITQFVLYQECFRIIQYTHLNMPNTVLYKIIQYDELIRCTKHALSSAITVYFRDKTNKKWIQVHTITEVSMYIRNIE